MSPLTTLTSCHCIVCKLCLFWLSVLVGIVQSATFFCLHLTVNAEGTLQREEWIVSTLQVPSGELGPGRIHKMIFFLIWVLLPAGCQCKDSVISTGGRRRQWSLQVRDDVSDLYSRKTTSVISTGERRRQWSLQVRDDVSDLCNWETTSEISTGERRHQWSLQVRDDVSDLYRWETTSEICM